MTITVVERGHAYLQNSSANLTLGASVGDNSAFSPAANTILLVVYLQSGDTTPGISGITGHGTWGSGLASPYYLNEAFGCFEVWACKVTDTSSGSVVVSRAEAWQGVACLFEIGGTVDLSGSGAAAVGVVSTANKTQSVPDSTITVTLGSFARAGGLTFVVGSCASSSFEGGYTALTQHTDVSGYSMRAGYIASEDNSVVVTSSAWKDAQAIAFEIKGAASGGTYAPSNTVRPRILTPFATAKQRF